MRRSLAILLALALLTSLTGCVRNPSPAQVVQPVELPEPEPREPELMLGEKIISDPENVTLYYTAGDGSSFTTLIRGLSTTSDESLLDRAMSALLRSNLSRDLLANLPADTTFLEVEFACGIATVRLSLDAYNAVTDVIAELGVPVIMVADIGHVSPMMPLIIGSHAKVTACDNDLTVEMSL